MGSGRSPILNLLNVQIQMPNEYSKFVTAVPHLLYLNYNVYLIEVTGDFETGKAASQLFALKSGGRRDGEPIRALLPIG